MPTVRPPYQNDIISASESSIEGRLTDGTECSVLLAFPANRTHYETERNVQKLKVARSSNAGSESWKAAHKVSLLSTPFLPGYQGEGALREGLTPAAGQGALRTHPQVGTTVRAAHPEGRAGL